MTKWLYTRKPTNDVQMIKLEVAARIGAGFVQRGEREVPVS